MKLNLDLITTPSQLQELANKLSGEEVIAIDTEFIRERTYIPQLALIQVANREEVWLIDNLSFNQDSIKPLLELLTNPKIIKILHSAFGDQECFLTAFGITASPTLDTFEAASLLGYGESVSLRDLIKKVLDIKIPKFLTRTDWIKRPISDEMKRYAMADVEYLVDIAEQLMAGLEEKNRKEWAFNLSKYFENPKLYQDNYKDITKRLARSGRVQRQSYPILIDLVKWREDRARQINIPRKRVADDDTLISIANSRPRSLAQLSRFRGIHPKEIKQEGDYILQLVQKDHNSNKAKLPEPPKIVKPSPNQTRVIDFLSTYLKSLCQEYKIASRLILTVRELQRIVVDHLTEPQSWVEEKLCTQDACDLIGKELQAALLGKMGLVIESGTLKKIEI